MTSVSTGFRVSKSEWNGKCVVRASGAEAINAALEEQKGKLDKAIALLSLDENFHTMTAAQVKQEVSGGKPRKVCGHLVSDVFREYIDTDMKENTKDIYACALKKVISFSGPGTRIEDIDLRWLRSFEKYLSRTQSVNGYSVYLRSLRAVCNYAMHTRLISSYPFTNFKIASKPTKKRSVSVKKLREFMYYPTSERNAMYRDFFFLMFYLIGINSKDLFLAKKKQVVSGRLEYIREKTGKHYSIKIEPEAEELIQRYAGENEYLLNVMDHCVRYKSFSRQINESIGSIGETITDFVPDPYDLFGEEKAVVRTIPVIPGITTYYARHTWATLAYELGIPIDVISQALGHSMGNRTTLIYIKPDREKVDQANRKVIDYLLGKTTPSV